MRTAMGVLIVALAVGGCADGETTDRRGYTKAPLEVPGIRVDNEARSEMGRLGTPQRPRGEPIVLAADTTGTD